MWLFLKDGVCIEVYELKGKRTIIICTHNLIVGKEISDNMILVVGGKKS